MKNRILDLKWTFRKVFIEGDTTTIRVLLAVGSLGWTVGLWLPLHTFDRPLYAGMAALASENIWGAAFLLHFIGVTWRTVTKKPSIPWGLAVNGYGLFIWLVSTGLVTSAVGEYSPGTAMEWAIILASFVALCRTGLNRESTTP